MESSPPSVQTTYVRETLKVGRNEPCPCGSGRKYKRCCFAKDTAAANAGDELAWQRVRRVLGDFSHTLLNFMLDTYGDTAMIEAWAEFMRDDDLPFDGRTPHAGVFYSWLFYRWSPDPADTEVADTSLLDIPPARALLNRKGRHLDPILRRYIEAALSVPYTFYQVLSSEPGRGFRAREFFSGREYDVFEKAASAQMRPGELFFGALVPCEGIWLLEAVGAVSFPPIKKIDLIELRQRYGLDATVGDAALRDLDLEMVECYLHLADERLNPAAPELRNTDGDPLTPQKLIFDIDSAEEAFVALRDLEFLASEQQLRESAQVDAGGRVLRANIVWQGRGNRVHAAWSNTTLGQIAIDGRCLSVEVNSDARAEKIREIVRSRLGGAARFRATEKRSMEDMLAEAGETSGAEDDADQAALMRRPEVQAQLRQMLAAHYDVWIDTALPALRGQTPLQAVASADGREMVEALIADIELHGERQTGFDPEITTRLRQRLGLDKRT